MTSSNGVVDGSWNLTISVGELNTEKTLRVRGDLHIGGLMLQLVNGLVGVTNDWSDYGLWWPSKSMWLLRTRSTLDQYGVQADALLQFTPMHKTLRILLPDLQIIDLRVNFSTNVFSVVIKMCKELGIRHPEELSLSRYLSPEELRKNQGVSATRRTRPASLRSPSVGDSPQYSSNLSLMYPSGTPGSTLQIHSPGRYTPNKTASRGSLLRTSSIPLSPYGTTMRSPCSLSVYNANGTMTPGSVNSLFFGGCSSNGPDSPLANSPQLLTSEAFDLLYRPRGFVEKARTNAGWFDSSRSLMEQGVVENSLVLLKYKFYAFYDLNPKYDAVRINQIYEQAKWSLLSEELDCTLEEMIVFAALQLQVQVQSQLPQHSLDYSYNGCSVNEADEDHIDAALNELQRALEGCTSDGVTAVTSPSPSKTTTNNQCNRPCSDLLDVPQLADYLRYLKPKKGLWWRSYKKCFFVFRDTCLSMFRTSQTAGQTPVWSVNLKGCEVCPDVSISTSRFNIKVFVTSSDGVVELWLRTDTPRQYTEWMAAIRLACKGRTMADSSAYESEMYLIDSLLGMQQSTVSRSAPATPSSALTSPTPNNFNIQPQDFVAPKYVRKLRNKQLIQRIMEAHGSVCNMTLMEAKLNYIRAWQSLRDYGITYFIVRFKHLKREELLGVAHNRLIRFDLHSGDILRTWHFPHMKSWTVNWDLKQVQVSFEEEDLAFQCFTADCKVVHEFIGGYIFLSMRSGDRSQTLNEELFHKLTGGWL